VHVMSATDQYYGLCVVQYQDVTHFINIVKRYAADMSALSTEGLPNESV
jgi:hypothetical protein